MKTLTKEELIAHGQARYSSKRKVGIPGIRKDGSRTSANTDIEAAAAEYFAATTYGAEFNDEVTTTGDGGADFHLQDKSVEVIWLGMTKFKQPRKNGNLIVNPHEPHRWADLYVVVKGSIDTGFGLAGWTTHKELIDQPRKDFGYGERFAMNITDLHQTNLKEEVEKGKV